MSTRIPKAIKTRAKQLRRTQKIPFLQQDEFDLIDLIILRNTPLLNDSISTSIPPPQFFVDPDDDENNDHIHCYCHFLRN